MERKTLCIFGLGYVGFPLARLAAEKNYKVIGVDIDKEKIELINNGIFPICEEGPKNNLKILRKNIKATDNGVEAVKKSDIIVVCVPTPVDENFSPDLSCIKSAIKTIAAGLKKNHLVIIESTLSPLTTEEDIVPILEKSGLKAGEDFALSFCPERIDPGNRKFKLRNIPRVLGGINERSAKKGIEFYNSVLDAEVISMDSLRSAEAVKIMENSFRDINIAFINEMAKSFDQIGIDIVDVLKGASTKPFAFMAHYPGCGVGGHCIPVDSYYLIQRAIKKGFRHQFLQLARTINNSMPEYAVDRAIEGLNEAGININSARINVLGLAYKKHIKDTRGSPGLKIIKELKKRNGIVGAFDPHALQMGNLKNIRDAFSCDCIIIATDHDEFKNLGLSLVKEKGVKVIVDGRNILDKEKIKKMGIIYKGIGR